MSRRTSPSKTDWRGRIRHAFSIDTEDPLSEDDLEFLDVVVEKISKRRMSVPSAFFFHMLTPLNFVTAQGMIVLEPLLGPLVSEAVYKKLIRILSHRDGLRIFVEKLEQSHLKNE